MVELAVWIRLDWNVACRYMPKPCCSQPPVHSVTQKTSILVSLIYSTYFAKLYCLLSLAEVSPQTNCYSAAEAPP